MLALRNWNGDGTSVGTNMTRREDGDPLNVKTGRACWQWLFFPRWVRIEVIAQKTLGRPRI
jgi:hypothetical protein